MQHADPADPDPGSRPASSSPGPSVRATAGQRQPEKDQEFAVFYRDHLRAVVVFLLYQGASLPDAAEVAQEAMIEAFRQWWTIERPKTWIRTVAARMLVRRVAAVRDILTEAVPEGTPLLPAPAPAAEWEQRHEVLRVISQLPPRQRQVMAWTFDGYTPAEIAEILRLAPDAVRQSLAKARRALADHLRTASKGGHQ